MDRATGIFNVLLSRAASIPRNYIIDQTNVYKNARRRKLKPFADFQKVYIEVCLIIQVFNILLALILISIFCPHSGFQIAVVVFPKPEELQCRSAKRSREMGKEVPADAVNDMLGLFSVLSLQFASTVVSPYTYWKIRVVANSIIINHHSSCCLPMVP